MEGIVASHSRILFIIICSNAKVTGGESYSAADKTNSIFSHLSPRNAQRLSIARGRVLKLLQDHPDAHLGGVPVIELPLSQGLSVGPEFRAKVAISTNRYLPAIERYDGRFYSCFDPDGKRCAEIISKSPHHVLIVSGLYGLVMPLEPIQSYSCHVGHHPDIAGTWQSLDLLTRLIADYIESHKIHTVIDLMADEDLT